MGNVQNLWPISYQRCYGINLLTVLCCSITGTPDYFECTMHLNSPHRPTAVGSLIFLSPKYVLTDYKYRTYKNNSTVKYKLQYIFQACGACRQRKQCICLEGGVLSSIQNSRWDGFGVCCSYSITDRGQKDDTNSR